MIPVVRELEVIRKAQGISQVKLAKKAGYERTTLNKWLRGETRTTLDCFVDTANALGYEVVLVEREVRVAG